MARERDDRSRARPGDGVGARLRWYAWAASQYAVSFAIGTVALLVAVVAFAAAEPLLVPWLFSAEGYGWALAVWIVVCLFAIKMWIKERMIGRGVESR